MKGLTKTLYYKFTNVVGTESVGMLIIFPICILVAILELARDLQQASSFDTLTWFLAIGLCVFVALLTYITVILAKVTCDRINVLLEIAKEADGNLADDMLEDSDEE